MNPDTIGVADAGISIVKALLGIVRREKGAVPCPTSAHGASARDYRFGLKLSPAGKADGVRGPAN